MSFAAKGKRKGEKNSIENHDKDPLPPREKNLSPKMNTGPLNSKS